MTRRGAAEGRHPILAALGVLALVTATLVAAPATGVGPAEPASAATVACPQLAHGEACTLKYADHPGQSTITIPASVDEVTVMLAGASGAGGGDDQGAPGPGGIVIATIDVSGERSLDVWLGDHAHGRSGGGDGWSSGGEGGRWIAGNDGYGGGASSGLAFTSQGHGDPLLVAGGGGGGGGSVLSGEYSGGAGGFGGAPAGAGADGHGELFGAGGGGGSESGPNGGHGGELSGDLFVGGGGGAGGGGYRGGGGGGYGAQNIYFPQFSTGGGGGRGRSFARDDVDWLGNGTSPLGPGWITVYAGSAERYECTGHVDGDQLAIPDGVTGYTVIAVGGAGSPGNSKARGGHGAVVSGVLDVRGMESLTYWVGCSGEAAGELSGQGYGRGGHGGHAPSPEAKDGGHGGGATAIAAADGTMLVVAGGGGGAGGDIANCESAPGDQCGGMGGSGGGSPGSRLPANGAEGGGDGGDGGIANSHHVDGQPSTNGDVGVEPACCDESGGGGGGGAGYPMGGGGGHHSRWAAGGGGGAGGSYVNSQYVVDGAIATSGSQASHEDLANGYLLLLPIITPNFAVTVEKTVTGAADEYAQGPFSMTMQCTLEGRTVVDAAFTLDPGQDHVVQVPDQSECTVTETGTGGASDPAPPQQFTVDGAARTVTMSNGFAATSLAISVRSSMIAENGLPTDSAAIDPGELALSVSCTLDGHELALPSPVVNGAIDVAGAGTFAEPGLTVTIDGLPVGASCTVFEHPDSGATRTFYEANGVSVAERQPFTLGAEPNTLDVANEYDLAPLLIQKALDGSGSLPPGTFGGTVGCTFHGAPVTFTGGDPAFTGLIAGGEVTVHELPVGGRCTVTETETLGAAAVTYTPRTLQIDPENTQMIITNVFDESSLIVQVASSGEGLAWANTDLALSVVCVDPENNAIVLSEPLTTPPVGGWASYEVDENMSCTVTETGTGGATSVRYASSADGTPSAAPVEVTVGADPATLYVDNVFDAAPVDVSVTTSGDGTRFADPSAVTVSDCTFNGLPVEIAPGAAEIVFGFAAAGGHASIPELVVGAQCLVTLSNTGGATSATVSVTNGAPDAPQGDWATTMTVRSPGTSVAFASVFDVAALEVTKAVVGDGAWATNTAYAVDVTCTLDGLPIDQLGPEGLVTLQFLPDGTPIESWARAALATLPVGASCAIVETEDGGATAVAIEPNGAIPVEAGGASATITNTFDAAALTVGKVVGGNDALSHELDPFSFEFGCTFNGRPIGNPPSDPNRSRTFTLLDGGTAAFGDLPVGAECEVIELDDRHATSVTPSRDQSATIVADGVELLFTNTFDVASLTIQEVVTGPGADTYGLGQTFFAQARCTYPGGDPVPLDDGGRTWLDSGNGFTETVQVPIGATCSAEQPLQLATTQTISDPVTILLGNEHTLVITSDYQVGDLTVGKHALGDFSASREFGFTIDCTFAERLRSVDDPPSESPVTVPLNGDVPADFTLTSGEDRTVEALVGARCTATETSAGGALRTASDAAGSGAISGTTSASVIVSAAVPGTIAVTNWMPGSLPVTGLELAWLIPLALLLIALGALVVIVRSRARASRPVQR